MELWQSVTPRSVFLNSFTLHMLGPAPLCEVMQETQKGSCARCSVKALQDPSSGHVWFVAHGKGFLRDCCSPKQHKNMMLLSVFCHLGFLFLNSVVFFIVLNTSKHHNHLMMGKSKELFPTMIFKASRVSAK